MELFIIHCTTCKARLKVRDEATIGDILACPKCNSMVHIVPPIGWKRSAGPQAALSESAIQPPPPNEISKPIATKAKAPVIAPPLPMRAPAPVSSSVEITPQVAATTMAAGVHPLSGAGAPQSTVHAVWMATVARLKQDWMLYSGGLAVGVVIGIVGVWLVVGTAEQARPTVADHAPRAQATLVAPIPPAKQTNPPDTREEPLALKPPGIGEVTDARPQSAPRVSEDLGEGIASEPAHESSDRAEAPSQSAETSEPATTRLPKQGVPALRLDPVPATRSEVAGGPADPATGLPSAADETAQVEDASKTGLMETISPAGAGDPTAAGAASRGRDGRSLGVTEIEERLSSTALPTVQFVQVPLAHFVEFIGDLTSLRITIDEAALKAAGQGRQSPVTVRLTNTTADTALGAGLKSLGLTSVARDGKLVITTAKGQGTDP